MACGILLVTVMAVSSALSAGQQQSLEARLKVAGSMAADDLMGRILVRPPAEIMTWHGFREEPGEMRTATGDPFPDHFRMIGREVSVLGTSIVLDDLGVTVSGRRIVVRIFDSTGRDLIVLERFLSAGGGA